MGKSKPASIAPADTIPRNREKKEVSVPTGAGGETSYEPAGDNRAQATHRLPASTLQSQ